MDGWMDVCLFVVCVCVYVGEQGGNCTPCSPGFFGIVAGRPRCQACPAGYVSGSSGEVGCTPCPVGHFAPQVGLRACQHCAEGSVAERAGRSSCTVCSPGRFSSHFGISCKACAIGSFQPSWGQTSCILDTVGLISPISGLIQPDNEDGFYALWDPATNITDFGVERCAVSPQACLSAGRCADGATGRQCFACMPGRGSSPSCDLCLAREVYLAIAIVAFVACVATYLFCAVALVRSASASPYCHMVLLKMMLNHCLAISVLSSAIFRAAMRMGYSDPVIHQLLGLLAITDGTLPSDNWLFSLPCLLQPSRGKALEAQMEELTGVFHSEYFSETRSAARQALVNFQWWTEMRLLVCWAATPLVAVALVLLLLLIRLRLYMSSRSELLACSTEFCTQAYFFGWEVTKRLWEVDVSEQLVEMYNTRLWGVCWPLHHVKCFLHARKRRPRRRGLVQSCCYTFILPIIFLPQWLAYGVDLRRFWVESAPLRVVLLYCLYFSVARKSMRALHCIWLGGRGQIDRAVIYSSGALQCGWSQSLHYIALFLGILWAAVWPAWTMYGLYRTRRPGRKKDAERLYAVLLLGFSHTRWWWEAAVFTRKFFLILLEAIPLQEQFRFLLFTCLGLLALLAHLASNPCDRRWHSLLTQMENAHLVIIIVVSSLSYFAIQGLIGFATVVICCAALHVTFIVVAMFCLADAASMILAGTLDHDKVLLRTDDSMLSQALRFLLRMKTRREAMEPYVSYDNVHRFVTVTGRGGDQAAPPYLPSGAELYNGQEVNNELQSGSVVVRTRLSEVGFQRVLEGRRTESMLTEKRFLLRTTRKEFSHRSKTLGAKVPIALRRQVARQLLFTAEHIASTRSASSVSILDFVVRGMFMIVHDSRSSLDDGPRELDRSVWVEAYRRKDIVYLASADQAEGGSQNAQKPTGLVDRDLQQLEEMVFSWDHWELCQKVAALHEKDDWHTLRREDFESAARALQQTPDSEQTSTKEGAAPNFDWEIGSSSSEGSAPAARIRSLEDVRHLRETVQKKVARMFSPKIFRRGLLLREMKHALTKLRQTPPEELKLWLDLFERSWFPEFKATDKELHHLAGTHLESSTNVEFTDILHELPRPEQRERSSRHMSEELNLTVCLKWVRFLLHYYCGGIQVVQLGDVMRTRLTRPNRRMIRTTMAQMHTHPEEDTDEEDGVPSPGALQRADKGIDAFLGPLPDEGAMERLDRGHCRDGREFKGLAASSGLMAQDGESCAGAGVEAARRDPSMWMRAMSDLPCTSFGERRLVDVTLPGSHDAGAFWLEDRAASCGARCHACALAPSYARRWGLAQGGDILSQLRNGVRFLDLRLTVDDAVAGCAEVSNVTGACWKVHHCLLGVPVANVTADLRRFLEDDEKDVQRQGELVIVRAKLQYFETTYYFSGSDPALTRARLEALRATLEEELMPFLYSRDGAWWMETGTRRHEASQQAGARQRTSAKAVVAPPSIILTKEREKGEPIAALQRTGRRLIFLLQADSAHGWLNELEAQGITHLKAFGKCETDAALGSCSGALWGKYSNTCCKLSKLGNKQRDRQLDYAEDFLPNQSCAEARRSNGTRPMFQLYWTMTFKVSGSMTDDNGLSSQDMPVFANVLMGDRLESSRTFLETAVRSSLRRCEMPDSGDDVDAPNDAWIKFAVMGIIIISACVVLALGCYTYSVLRGRDDFRRRSLAARASQASLLIWTGLASATGAPMVQLCERRATAPARTAHYPLRSGVLQCDMLQSSDIAFRRFQALRFETPPVPPIRRSQHFLVVPVLQLTRSSVPGVTSKCIDRALEINFKCEL
eukprot:s2428_g3.t14